jgi:signal recognition particle subunit SRP54
VFDNLTDRLTGIFNRLQGKGRLTENDIDEALGQVRRSLLEADVNFRVARDFVANVKERSLGSDVLESLTPGQQVVKIVHEELTEILSAGDHRLTPSSQLPSVLMLVGLQGSGKTTTAAKLALQMRRQNHSAMMVAADLRRPAAISQLETLGRQLDVPVYSEDPASSTPAKVAVAGVRRATELAHTWVIVDTGGRLHIDDDLMGELEDVKAAVSPHEVLLVVDAMTGQDAVNAAQEFHQRVGLDGLVMSKMDGDARGGAALSITRVTGVPIKFIGTSERPDGLEAFHPDRMASRILAMGDVMTLIERAQEAVSEEEAKDLERKMRTSSFTLDDFLDQIQKVQNMGGLASMMEMLPGLGQATKKMKGQLDEGELRKTEAIIRSMTRQERSSPEVIKASRRRRIALGSGTNPSDVNRVLNQFKQTQKLMRQFSNNPRGLMRMFR